MVSYNTYILRIGGRPGQVKRQGRKKKHTDVLASVSDSADDAQDAGEDEQNDNEQDVADHEESSDEEDDLLSVIDTARNRLKNTPQSSDARNTEGMSSEHTDNRNSKVSLESSEIAGSTSEEDEESSMDATCSKDMGSLKDKGSMKIMGTGQMVVEEVTSGSECEYEAGAWNPCNLKVMRLHIWCVCVRAC